MDHDRVMGMMWGAVTASASALRYRNSSDDVLTKIEEKDFDRPSDREYLSYPKGGWSAHLEPLFVQMETIAAAPECMFDRVPRPGKDTAVSGELAQRLVNALSYNFHYWCKTGFGEWRDTRTPYETDPQLFTTTNKPDYLSRPLVESAKALQHRLDACVLLRSLASAAVPTPTRAEQLALLTCKTTHASDHVAAVTVYITLHLHQFLYKVKAHKDTVVYPAERMLVHDVAGQRGTVRAMSARTLEKIGGRDYSGTHTAALRAFVWTFRQILDYENLAADARPALPQFRNATLIAVCKEGGTTDINCALAGALLGAWGGLDIVPAWREEVHQGVWVGRRIKKFADACTLSSRENNRPRGA
jgi:hypothetical protein